eukprot:403340117
MLQKTVIKETYETEVAKNQKQQKEIRDLQRLQKIVKVNKVKITMMSAVQLAFDINHIINSILNSQICKNDNDFKQRIMNIPDLEKWRILINELTEGQLIDSDNVISEESKIMHDDDFKHISQQNYKMHKKPPINQSVRIKPSQSLQIHQSVKESIQFLRQK